jgi:RNA polymerase sigma-70 factor (ECF subfamily)
MTADEGHLVALAKLGDNTAFEELYLQNKEKIFHLIFRYTRSRQDAEDLLQETFFRAFFSIRRFDARGGAAFSTWLFRIGINCSINFVKKHKKQRAQREYREPLPGDSLDCRRSNPEETAAFNELVAELEAGLNSLPARQRMIFVLKHHEGLKAREIAHLMKCSEGSVKKQLNRAMAKLVKKLAVHTLTEGKDHEDQMP